MKKQTTQQAFDELHKAVAMLKISIKKELLALNDRVAKWLVKAIVVVLEYLVAYYLLGRWAWRSIWQIFFPKG